MDTDDCPVCCNPFPVSERSFQPCPCGFRMCVWCWHTIMTADFSDTLMKPRCPNCRELLAETPRGYSVDAVRSAKKQRQAVDAKKVESSKRPLIDAAVDDGRLVVVEGLPPRVFPNPRFGMRHEYFGQYGRVVAIAIIGTTAAVRYSTTAEADRAVAALHGSNFQPAADTSVHMLAARKALSKWCTSYLYGQRCPKLFCVDLHEPRRADQQLRQGLATSEAARWHDNRRSKSTIIRDILSEEEREREGEGVASCMPPSAASKATLPPSGIIVKPFELGRSRTKPPASSSRDNRKGRTRGTARVAT